MARDNVVRVRLDDEELAAVDSAVGTLAGTRGGVVRAAALAKLRGPAQVPSRDGALALLAGAAENGSVVAAAALARELRLGGAVRPPRTGPVTADELRAELYAIE